jgi:hypothetical protein
MIKFMHTNIGHAYAFLADPSQKMLPAHENPVLEMPQ